VKLIRDLIPRIIEESGRSCEYHIADEEEYKKSLCEKMQEELGEFFENPCYEEAADMYEVLSAICDLYKLDMSSVESTAYDKREQRGGFADGIILEKVHNDPE
jgi:predicted house-cleaning noncanonical NTP pyrophosphatase (MazG superfamily)